MSDEKNKNDRVYYFTWGTLKRGFPNHDDHKEVLDTFIGEFSTKDNYTLIVPHDIFCPNPGCKYVHKIGALTDEVSGHGAQITGEVFSVTKKGLKELDKLEDYHRCLFKKSTYVRKKVELVSSDNNKTLSAYIYVIKEGTPYIDLLNCNKAISTPTYTKQMANEGRDYKNCCKKDPCHAGDHDKLPIPTCNC
jgi:gamma-glutamylcyclotransferase (GGCT)/AIG2-like uncharacterized protein YtfP